MWVPSGRYSSWAYAILLTIVFLVMLGIGIRKILEYFNVRLPTHTDPRLIVVLLTVFLGIVLIVVWQGLRSRSARRRENQEMMKKWMPLTLTSLWGWIIESAVYWLVRLSKKEGERVYVVMDRLFDRRLERRRSCCRSLELPRARRLEQMSAGQKLGPQPTHGFH